MQTIVQQLPSLAEYVGPHELLPEIKNHIPSRGSLDWYVRNHRDALAEAGAVIVVAGRLRYHPKPDKPEPNRDYDGRLTSGAGDDHDGQWTGGKVRIEPAWSVVLF